CLRFAASLGLINGLRFFSLYSAGKCRGSARRPSEEADTLQHVPDHRRAPAGPAPVLELPGTVPGHTAEAAPTGRRLAGYPGPLMACLKRFHWTAPLHSLLEGGRGRPRVPRTMRQQTVALLPHCADFCMHVSVQPY
ncbi:unnamed protein product, partial [Ixodes pacificus]